MFLSKGHRILVRDCSEWELSPEVGRDRLLRKDRLEHGLEPSRKPFTIGIHRFPIHFGVIWRLWQRFAGGGWGGPSPARGPRDWPGLGPGPARTGLVRAGLLRLGEVWRQRVGEVWRGVRCGEVWSGLARRGEVRRGLLRYAGVGRGLASTPHEPHRLQVPPSRRREGGVAGGIG